MINSINIEYFILMFIMDYFHRVVLTLLDATSSLGCRNASMSWNDLSLIALELSDFLK